MKEFFSIEKKEAIKGARFFLLVVLIYSALFFATFFLPIEFFELMVAKLVLLFSGLKGEIVFQEPVLIHFESFTVGINFLCTGLMELFILIAAILATPETKLRKKVVGLTAAFIATLFFNVLRITATIHAIESGQLSTATFTHDILFRLSLLVVIAGVYGTWFWWVKVKSK
jgi:exosortase/archaeosortase family protein